MDKHERNVKVFNYGVVYSYSIVDVCVYVEKKRGQKMYFNVVVKSMEQEYEDGLSFTFHDLNEAFKFAKMIMSKWYYNVEILGFKEDE